MSAMRPANTETYDGAPPAQRVDDVAHLLERHERGDVQLDAARATAAWIRSYAGSRRVFVTGIFT